MRVLKYITSMVLLTFMIGLSSCATDAEIGTYQVEGIAKPEISLNGDWDFSMTPPKSYTAETIANTSWEKAQVPGGLMMQGFPIRHDSTYLYKRSFSLPSDFAEHKILLRFDGVHSEAHVWVNGEKARNHLGGFTRWEVDVTDLVKQGSNELWVAVKDRRDDISWASGYAKHQVGGILRDVTLRAIPKNHLSHFYIETDFDEVYENATLRFDISTTGSEVLNINWQLLDPKGKEIKLNTAQVELAANAKQPIENEVTSPMKWDAEHPNLYTLNVQVNSTAGSYSFTEKIGFRELKVVDDQLFVNGMPVKLRGANRHDVHPTLGRMTTREMDSLDVMLAKEANINWIRTSHYPPSDYFLDLCDREGIYVEDETAVCFVQTYRDEAYKPDAFNNDPTYTDWFLGQMEEMVHWHRNHPSVIIWSIGNENSYGTNFQKSYDRIKELDPSRPAIFSFPGTVPDSVKVYDILSMHYVNYDGSRTEWTKSITNFSEPGIPTVHDEYAHVACYNVETIQEDANVRVFWQESIDRMWSDIFNQKGALGAAIWCFIDETFMIPENTPGYKEWWGKHNYDFPHYTVGYGEWGIIDSWRRKKPEFWATRKAYSPAKLFIDSLSIQDDRVIIPLQNRFDHTNFNELTIEYTFGQTKKNLYGVNLEPHAYGQIAIPINSGDDFIELNFFKGERLIDSYHIQLHSEFIPPTANDLVKLELSAQGQISFEGEKDSRVFREVKPIIRTLSDQNSSGGVPLFYDWMEQAKTESASQKENEYLTTYKVQDVYVTLKTTIDKNEVTFQLGIDGYLTDKNVREIGLELALEDLFDSLSWNRTGHWTQYPENDLGALSGKIALSHANQYNYRKQPEPNWAMDGKSFYYHGTDSISLPYMASAYKENIQTYTLSGEDLQITVAANENNQTAARIYQDESGAMKLRLAALLDYPNLAWGNYMRNLKVPDYYTAEFKLYLEREAGQ